MTAAASTLCSTPSAAAAAAPGAAPDLALSPEQKRFFDFYGFLVLPGILAGKIQAITASFEAIWELRTREIGGPAHTGTARTSIQPFIDQDEVLSGLLDDPGIHGAACSLLGDDFN